MSDSLFLMRFLSDHASEEMMTENRQEDRDYPQKRPNTTEKDKNCNVYKLFTTKIGNFHCVFTRFVV